MKNKAIKKINKYIANNIYTFLLLFGISIICLNLGLENALTVDFSPINGDFQNYNVWRRFLNGQIPYKDFPVYLGSGHLILGSILTGILGNTFRMSLVASHF